MTAVEKATQLMKLSALIPQAAEQIQAVESSLLASIQSQLEGHSDFVLFHGFEPNGRLTVAHAVRYVAASRAVSRLGGRYILFIDDVVASQRLAFDHNAASIAAAADYALYVFQVLGVIESHTTVYRGTEFSLPNPALFLEVIANSIKVPIKQVQSALPSVGKKEVMAASQLIAPCLQSTQVLHLGADFLVAPARLAAQAELIKAFQPEKSPVVITLPDVINLKGPKANPPKPDPKNVVFFDDDEVAIAQKMNAAFCTDETAANPVFQYIAYVVIPFFGGFEFNGKTYTNDNLELANDFAGLDKKALKAALAGAINKLVAPVRDALAAADAPEAVKKAASFATTQQ
jgi:tryptophanyl-tRNA synthetase